MTGTNEGGEIRLVTHSSPVKVSAQCFFVTLPVKLIQFTSVLRVRLKRRRYEGPDRKVSTTSAPPSDDLSWHVNAQPCQSVGRTTRRYPILAEDFAHR